MHVTTSAVRCRMVQFAISAVPASLQLCKIKTETRQPYSKPFKIRGMHPAAKQGTKSQRAERQHQGGALAFSHGTKQETWMGQSASKLWMGQNLLRTSWYVAYPSIGQGAPN